MAVQIRQPAVSNEAVINHSPGAQAQAAERFQTPDQLFGLLDGRTVMAVGQLWKVEVFGIRDLSGQRWLQLGLQNDDARRMATLRVSAGGNLEHVITALAEWSADADAETNNIFNIA